MAGHTGRARGDVHNLSIADLGLLADQVVPARVERGLAKKPPAPSLKARLGHRSKASAPRRPRPATGTNERASLRHQLPGRLGAY
jgi:hypothetical protein